MGTHSGVSRSATSAPAVDPRATRVTRQRYDRISRFYDLFERGVEHRHFATWRADLWARIRGPRVLEVGVGTGKNIPYYPPGLAITAIDLSPGMLRGAHHRAREFDLEVKLLEADVQELPFPDGSFDSAVATFVFCSVPDPILGLMELRRVLKPGGELVLLEHVLSEKQPLRTFMQLANAVVVRMMGANINRETVSNVARAGFIDVRAEDRWLDVVKVIAARAPDRA